MFKFESRNVIIIAISQAVATQHAQDNHLSTYSYFDDLEILKESLVSHVFTKEDTIAWVTPSGYFRSDLAFAQLMLDEFNIEHIMCPEPVNSANLMIAPRGTQ